MCGDQRTNVCEAGELVVFDGTASHDNDEDGASITYYRWSVDGGTQYYTSGTFTWVFENTPGGEDFENHTVMLEVKDDEGVWATKTITIKVYDSERRFYNLTDHLGNVRATVTGEGEMVSKDAYRSGRNV